MKTTKMTLGLILTLLTLAAGAQTAEAVTLPHMNRLATRLQFQTRQLDAEFNRHFRQTRAYDHLIADTAELYRLAGHIRSITRCGTGARHLREDVRELDAKFHHLEGVVQRVVARNRQWRGPFFQQCVEHVREVLHEMKETIHHMEEDARKMVRRANGHHGSHHGIHRPHGAHHGGYRPSHVVRPGYGYQSIRFGSPGFQIRFAF